MKPINYTLILSLIGLATILAACYDDKDPVAEIITPTGKGFYPVSGNTLTDLLNGNTSISTNRVYKPGTAIAFELQYWSDGPIKEINMYSTEGSNPRTQIYNKPYAEIEAFSKIKSADTLVLRYTTPAATATTTVKLEIEIVNENMLSLVRTLTIQSKP
jgi:hypothetical protein